MTTDPNVERIQCDLKEKCAAVFAVRRANYTHRRKGVFNAQSIEDLTMCGNCATLSKQHQTGSNPCYFGSVEATSSLILPTRIQGFWIGGNNGFENYQLRVSARGDNADLSPLVTPVILGIFLT